MAASEREREAERAWQNSNKTRDDYRAYLRVIHADFIANRESNKCR